MSSDIMSDEDKGRIEFTLKTRQDIIRSLMPNGQLPKDPNDRSVILASLDGMDRTVLSKAKIKSDDNASKGQAEVAKSMAELLLRVDSRRTGNRTIDVEDGVVLPAVTLVEGETFIGVQPVKYNEIMGDNA